MISIKSIALEQYNMNFKVFFISIILFLSGCASYSPTITSQQRKNLDTIGLYHDVINDQIRVQHIIANSGSATGASVGGLLGSLIGGAIDSGVNDKRSIEADKASAPFRTMLAGYQFKPIVTTALVNAVLNSGEIALSEPQDIPPGVSERGLLEFSNSDAILITKSEYMLSPDTAILEVKLHYTVVLKRINPKTAATTWLTSKTAVFQSAKENWDKKSLEKQLFRGANEVAKLLIMDLVDQRTGTEMKEHVEVLGMVSYQGSYIKTKVYKLGESVNGERRYFRLMNGDIYSIAAKGPIRLQSKII